MRNTIESISFKALRILFRHTWKYQGTKPAGDGDPGNLLCTFPLKKLCSSAIHLSTCGNSILQEADGSLMKFCYSFLLGFSEHGNFTRNNQTAPQNDIDIMGLHQ